jgi:septin family protein
VSSNTILEVAAAGGQEVRRTRGRRYPWGTVDIENESHSDFVALRNLLIRTNLLDLVSI